MVPPGRTRLSHRSDPPLRVVSAPPCVAFVRPPPEEWGSLSDGAHEVIKALIHGRQVSAVTDQRPLAFWNWHPVTRSLRLSQPGLSPLSKPRTGHHQLPAKRTVKPVASLVAPLSYRDQGRRTRH